MVFGVPFFCLGSQLAALETAHIVALVKPGDAFMFSGANPHMALCIGDPLSLTAYESFVNLNSRHLDVFCASNTKKHFKECHMRE